LGRLRGVRVMCGARGAKLDGWANGLICPDGWGRVGRLAAGVMVLIHVQGVLTC
jgi:hypothetical protein